MHPLLQPFSRPPLLMLTLGLCLFAAIAADVLMHGQLAQLDHPLAVFLHQHPAGPAILVASAISGLGEFYFIFPFALLVGLFLLFKKKYHRDTAIWALALLGSVLLNQSLKSIFKIPRPASNTFYIFPHDAGYSFPSGHTMAVTITAGTLALLYMHRTLLPRATRLMLAFAVTLLALLEAAALLYMGVHYLTDVTAALALSLAWLGVIRALLPPKKICENL